MKRHLIALALGVMLPPYLPAQDSYDSGYGGEPAYESNDNQRQFNFNPGDMMNNMGNPMRSMFGSSNRRYDAYPAYPYGRGYAPPAYGGYPAYQQPPANYGYAPQPPVAPGYPAPYGYPSAYPAQPMPAAPPESAEPVYEQAPPAAMEYQPMADPQQDPYRFRPMEPHGAPGVNQPAFEAAPGNGASPGFDQPMPPASAYVEPEPLAPLTYPGYAAPEPLAPLSYPAEPAPPAPAVEPQARDLGAPQDPGLKFRPLDKPGYSSELGQ